MVVPYIKDRVKVSDSSNLLYGTHIFTTDASCSEVLGRVGFDFVIIDAEHTENSYTSLRNHLAALNYGGTPTFVRVSMNTESHFRRVLELGPDGIIIPGINTAPDAHRAISMCLFPPDGERRPSLLRAAGYGIAEALSMYSADAAMLCRIIQLDSAEALRNIEEIVKVKNIDGFFFCPGALCGEDGNPGGLFGGDTMPLLENAARVLRENKKPFGVSLYRAGNDALRFWRTLGVSMAASGSDIGYIISGARENLRKISESSEG